MFAPVPLWERQRKTRRRGGRAAPTARDPALDAGEPGVGAAALGAAPIGAPADPVDVEGFRYEPIRAEHRRSAAPAGLVAAGVLAVAAAGALGWYLNRPSENGVAELTPGAPGSSELAIAAPPPVSPLPTSAAGAPPGAPMGVTPEMAEISPSREAANAAARRAESASARRSSSRDADRGATSRVRPAEANSVEDAGVNASATAPMINPPTPGSRSSASGPTLDMPPEQIDPALDPTLPANRQGAPAPLITAPATSRGATTP